MVYRLTITEMLQFWFLTLTSKDNINVAINDC